MANFKIFIEGNSLEGIHHWDVKSSNDSKHDNSKDFQDMQTVMNIIGNAVNQIDNVLIGTLKKEG